MEGAEGATAGLGSVTVVVNTYQDRHFLGQALASVDRQTHRADQVVVVDDGSDDDPREVVDGFAGVTYLRQPNQGLASARNTGLAATTSDAVVFLDADDELLPAALSAGLASFTHDPEAAFVCGGHRRVDAHGRVLLDGLVPPPQLDYAGLLRGNRIGMHATVMYRTERLRTIGGFDPDLRRCEDYDLYLRLARTDRISTHGEPVADYRQHGANMSSDPGDMLVWALRVLDRQQPFARDDPRLLDAYEAGREGWRTWYAPGPVSRARRRYGRLRRRLRGAGT